MSSAWNHAGVPVSAVAVSPAVAMPWLVELLVPRAGAAGHTLDGATLIESAAALSAAAESDVCPEYTGDLTIETEAHLGDHENTCVLNGNLTFATNADVDLTSAFPNLKTSVAGNLSITIIIIMGFICE